MSTNQQPGFKVTRLTITALLAAVVAAISLCYITFKSPSPSKGITQAPSSGFFKAQPVNEKAAVHPETSEVIQKMLTVVSSEPAANKSKNIHAYVTQPLPGIVPETISKTIQPGKGGSIECASGSLVYIPPHAFVDATGKPVNSEVKVSFTEYRDYKDIFLGGIPMTYFANGKQNHFESAGMMQLEASAANNAVYVNPQSRIKVMLASNTSKTDYDLYYFNKKKRIWEEKGKDQVTYKKKEIKPSVTAKRMAPYEPKQRPVYLASFEGVPEDRVFLWWRSPAKDFDFSFIRIYKSLPELKALSGMKWEYHGTDAKDVYAQLFNVPEKEKNKAARRGYWESYSAAMNPETATASITFFNAEESMSFTVRPKDRSEKNILKVRERMEKYNKLLEARLETDVVHYANYQRDSLEFSYDKEAMNTIKMDVMRSFQVDNFGIWNVDRIAKDANFTAYTLKLVDENGRPIVAEEIYLVDKNFNSVFKYSIRGEGTVRINPYSNNMLWVVLPGNKLAVASQSEIWKLAGKKGRQ